MATFQENVGKPIPAVKVSWILLQQKMSEWCHYVSCDDGGDNQNSEDKSFSYITIIYLPTLTFLQSRRPSCCPTNSVKALKVKLKKKQQNIKKTNFHFVVNHLLLFLAGCFQ